MPRVPDLTAPVRHATTTAAHPRPTGVGTTICVLILLLFGGLIGLIALIVFMTVGGRVIEGLRAQTAEAVVLSVRQETFCPSLSGPGRYSPCYPVYLPTVRFTTARGEQADAETADRSTDKSRVNVGRSLKVYYDPLNPHHVQTNRWLKDDDEREMIIDLVVLLLVLLFFGLLKIADSVKKRRSRQRSLSSQPRPSPPGPDPST